MAHHRKITTTMQVSLDGSAERPSGATDWIGTDPDTFDWEFLDRIDACVLGSGMYPAYEHYWRTINANPNRPVVPTGSVPTADEIRYAQLAYRTPHYVLTALLDAGLIEELRITVYPVVVGDGTPLFGHVGREHRLRLTSATPLESGLVRLVYGVG